MVMTMIGVSVFVGLLHLNLGFILGFINLSHHSMKHAVLEKGSWMIIELGVLVAALGYFGGISGLTYVGAGILVLGIVLLTMGEGIKGPIELPSLMGNTHCHTPVLSQSVCLRFTSHQYGQ